MVKSFGDFEAAVAGEQWEEAFGIFKEWLEQYRVDGEVAEDVAASSAPSSEPLPAARSKTNNSAAGMASSMYKEASPKSRRRVIFPPHMRNQHKRKEQEVARACLEKIIEDNEAYSNISAVVSFWRLRQIKQATKMQSVEALQMPFISLPNRKPPERKRKASREPSRNTNESRRQPLKLAYAFKIYFKPWKNFDQFIISAPIPPLKTEEDNSLVNAVGRMLTYSTLGYHATRGATGAKELLQLGDLENILKPLLKCFDFDMDVQSDPADDFLFNIISTQKTVLVGEGKDAKKLPVKVPHFMSHELCRFGLATWLAIEYTPDPPNLTGKLEQRLHLPIKKPTKSDDKKPVKKPPPTLKEENCSDIAKQLINDSDEEFHTVANNILEKLEQGKIKPADTNSLWGAVMQACLATVTNQCKYTLALSMENMWFIKLQTTASKECHLLLSDPVAVGSLGSNLTLFKFIHESAINGTMIEDESSLWEKALNEVTSKSKKKSGAGQKEASCGKRQQQAKGGSSGGQQKNMKRESGGRQKQVSSKRNHNGDVKLNSAHSGGACNADQVGEWATEPLVEEYMGRNEYGIVPFFHQIKHVVEDLGVGRCGTVKKIRWKNDFAALKEYMLDIEEDGRCFFEVFEHELEVLCDLEPLWGKYVPELLFHKPWPSRPLLGLQLGTPMPSDWSEWSIEERKQADDAIKAVRERHWDHGDVKGNNFVRLTDRNDKSKTSIALIDFEDAIPLKER